MKKTYKSIKLFIVLLSIVSMKMGAQALSGLYTINSGAATGGTNYQTFNAFATAINSLGISSGVTVNVVANSGPYVEQVTFNQITGANAGNRVTINGNNNLITFNSSNFAAPWTILLNGTDYFRFNNLQVQATGISYAFANVLTNNADYNIYTACTFSVNLANSNSTNVIPFMISGSSTAHSSSGPGANYNTVQTCTTSGGYNGISMYGNSSSISASGGTYLKGNQFIGNTIRDFYYSGVWNYYFVSGTVIKNNDISCPNMTMTATKSGVYCYYHQGTIVEGNKIHDLYNPSLQTLTGTCYGIYMAYNLDSYSYGYSYPSRYRVSCRNNIISDINFNGTIYGVYFNYTDGDLYNNTISLDQQGFNSGTTYGIYSYGSTSYPVTVDNNIVSITRAGNGTKYCWYAGGGSNAGNVGDKNVLYINAPAGTNYVGYYTTTAATQALFAALSPNANLNGSGANPTWASMATQDYHPTNAAIDNMAMPKGLLFDQSGAVRNQVTPDAGALEFLTPLCVGTPTIGGVSAPNYTICPGEDVNLGINNPSSASGITIQWQSSTLTPVGPWTNAAGATSITYTAPSVSVGTWFTPVITCTNSNQSISPVAQVFVAGVTTSTVNYYESFETIGLNNRLPNCSWSASNLGSNCLTYTSAVANSGGYANTGNGFARFAATGTGTNYFYTNGIQLNAGVTYSASMWYLTDYLGNVNWTDLSMMIGTAQTPTAQTLIVSSNGPVSSASYNSLSNTFTVATSGLYYMGIRGISSGINSPYLTFDDVRITVPCNLNSPSVTVNTANSSICAGQSATITASGAATYLWSNGATGSSIVVTPPSGGVYSVIGTNAGGCSSSPVVQNITVKPTPAVTILALPSTTVCEGSTLNLNGSGASTYTWVNTNSNNTGINITVTASATYTLLGASSNGCVGNATQLITMNSKPQVAIAATNTNVCLGDVTTLNGTGAVNFQWSSPSSFLQGNPVTVSPNANTSYTATGIDANGCSNTAVINFVVNQCVGINNITASNSGIKVYPNPNNGEFTVELNNNSNKTVSVLDVTGRVILTSTTSDDKVNFNINKFAAGIYYVKIQSINATEVLKVVKQ